MENKIEFLKTRLVTLSNRWNAAVNIQNAAKVKVAVAREYRKQLSKLNVLLVEAKQAKLPTPVNFMTEEDRVKARNKKD